MEGSKNRKKGSLQRQAFRDLLGGLVVRTPSFQRRECGFKPSSGNLDSADPTCHMAWQKNNNKKTKTSFHSWNFISPMNMLFFFSKAFKYSIGKLAWSLTQMSSNPSKKKKHRRPKFGVNDICSQKVT